MATTIFSWVPGTTVCFGMHCFVITADGSTELVQPAALPLPSPVSNTIDAALAPSTELGGAPSMFQLGMQNATRCLERLTLDILAPPDDVLNEDLGDSSSNSGSHHPSQECFMANTPEGQAQSASKEDDPSRTPNTGTVAGNPPQQLR